MKPQLQRAPTDSCPRCGQGFHCGAQETRCDCFELQISEALRQQLSQHYATCLCLSCLRELSRSSPAEVAQAQADLRPDL